MKNFKLATLSLLSVLALSSCSNDDDDVTPTLINEEEVITTLTVTLVPENGGDTVILKSQDLDGEGSDEPVVTVSGNFTADATYNGIITLLNETEDPAENITEEVEEEGEEHQFFYTVGTSLTAETTYSDQDANGNPIGLAFALESGVAGTGDLTFTLRHEPTKPNTGLDNAGGETDISATFNITVQ